MAQRKVTRVPCYTFHDGFSTYQRLLEGVLPTKLKVIRADQESVRQRFYKACVGWARYKPLLLYITQPEDYAALSREMSAKLNAVLPKICSYFETSAFMSILDELKKYQRNVERHYADFQKTQEIWRRLVSSLDR